MTATAADIPTGQDHAPRFTIEDLGPRVDGALDTVVDLIRRAVRMDDNDVFIWLDGDEGDGKSTIALRLGLGVDETFRPRNFVDQIHFRPHPYIRASRTIGPTRFVLADEGRNFVFNREGMRSGPRDYFGHLYEGRDFNQIHALCFPDDKRTDDIVEGHRADFRITPLSQKGWAEFLLPNQDGYWKKLFKFPFDPLTGPIWEAYHDMKMNYLTRRSIGGHADDPETRPARVRVRDDFERGAERIAQMINDANPSTPWEKD